MSEDVKAGFIEIGLNEQEAEFLIQNYGDMDLYPEDTHIYDDTSDFFEAQVELVAEVGVDVSSEPLSTMLNLVDPDEFFERVRDMGGNWEVVQLPSGRLAEISF